MKMLAILPQKVKMAIALVVLMALMVFSTLSIRYALQSVDQTLASVYKNRLQPAVELVYLNENLYAKRLLVETYLSDHSSLSITALRARLRQTTADSYQRIGNFEKTVLTEQEAKQLSGFKKNLAAYAVLERSMLQLIETGQHQQAVDLFEQSGYQLFQQAIQLLHQLAIIQHETGQQAVADGHQQAAGGAIGTTLLIGLAIILGLLIQQLLVSMTPQKQSFGSVHLN